MGKRVADDVNECLAGCRISYDWKTLGPLEILNMMPDDPQAGDGFCSRSSRILVRHALLAKTCAMPG